MEAELDELEGAELEEQNFQPKTTDSAPQRVPDGTPQARPPSRKNTAEEDEISKLQAELAL